jgi:NAD(P)-dependent dehydrogenase (short-subunit alcohol dehydrogenase family)
MTHEKNAVITGGSKGLGRALAFALGAQGYKLALVARHLEGLASTVADLQRAGVKAHPIVGDVGAPRDALKIAALAHQQLGHVDLLIHNASTLGPLPMPMLADLHSEDFLRVLQVNLLGPHRLTRALGGNMLLRGSGMIVNISSDAATEAYEGWGAYSAAKVALDHMSRIWAEETTGSGLRFLSIDPGEMNTQMHADALPEADPCTLADPDRVASQIAALLMDSELPSGSRVEARSAGHTS